MQEPLLDRITDQSKSKVANDAEFEGLRNATLEFYRHDDGAIITSLSGQGFSLDWRGLQDVPLRAKEGVV